MAKGIGLIGNFRGKVGNMVGYNLKDSNNKQTQGVRVYQPIVKNPKTAAQAEQRAKLLAVNATYRALKMVIDRGNESLPYGNKSRLAWLKTALKSAQMPWFVKGTVPNMPVGCPLTKGSLANVNFTINEDTIKIDCEGLAESSDAPTIGSISTALLAAYPTLKEGDQLTIVNCGALNGMLSANVHSIVLDKTSSVVENNFAVLSGYFSYDMVGGMGAGAVIVSRQGDNGEHLRSNTSLIINNEMAADAPYDADSKTAAIASYRASDAASGDWAEESIQ